MLIVETSKPTGEDRRTDSEEAGPSRKEHSNFDAEDAAMKQAMAYSLSETQSPIATGKRCIGAL